MGGVGTSAKVLPGRVFPLEGEEDAVRMRGREKEGEGMEASRNFNH